MNIAFFMQPKANVAFLYSDFTVRQALEKMHHHGYSAIPVINRDGTYVGTVSEGDFLWYIVQGEGDTPRTIGIEELERLKLSDIDFVSRDNPPIKISADIDELLMMVMSRNFIPVVDDRDMLIGIVTRRAVIRYFYDNTLDRGGDELEDSK